MPAERAGYTVTMFLIDTSPSMSKLKTIDLPPGPNGEELSTEKTHLEWGLEFVKLKIQGMIYHERKTDQCGIITFGSEDTRNIVNKKNGGYENVEEILSIAHPTSQTIAKVDTLEPSSKAGDPIDALIVGIETQDAYLKNKKTWTRKIVLITNGESPIEIEDWKATVHKMDSLGISLTVVGIDFDDPEFPFIEPDKSTIKRANEEFYERLTSNLQNGIVGTCALALREANLPDIKTTRSTLMGTVLRLGDPDVKPDEALEILVKTSKCTAKSVPKSWKKYAARDGGTDDKMIVDEEDGQTAYVQLQMRTEYYIDRTENREDSSEDEDKLEDDDENLLDEDEDGQKNKGRNLEKVSKEDLVKGFKYGTTYAPCPDGQFPKLRTRKGIELCGFFTAKNFRRELAMGEVQYVWADPSSPPEQVAMSSIVQAMYEKNVMAIARWVSTDGGDPKMGVLCPRIHDKVECFLWTQMPFADDVRKYTFPSLDNLLSKTGEKIPEHPFLPTEELQNAMHDFVDAMDLMEAEKDEEGNRIPWFDVLASYNPALHRVKQALFHCAIVSDVTTNPIDPPHPELTKYFDPPRRVLKRARVAIENCKSVSNVKPVPKKVARPRKDGHVTATEDDSTMLLLDRKSEQSTYTQSQMHTRASQVPMTPRKQEKSKAAMSGSETEDDEEDLLLEKKGPSTPAARKNVPFPTPARSESPPVGRGIEPGRIIGSTFPLKDFQKNLAQGDVVTKAVEDMSTVIAEIVMRPFADRRRDEMLDCMKALRSTCLEEDEIDAWNTFLEDFKDKCLSKPGNPGFWEDICKVGRELSLIGKSEASKLGGTSNIPDERADSFLS